VLVSKIHLNSIQPCCGNYKHRARFRSGGHYNFPDSRKGWGVEVPTVPIRYRSLFLHDCSTGTSLVSLALWYLRFTLVYWYPTGSYFLFPQAFKVKLVTYLSIRIKANFRGTFSLYLLQMYASGSTLVSLRPYIYGKTGYVRW